jgi:DNA-binding Xre family transcriptional regulator
MVATMQREEYLMILIKEQYKSVRQFAQHIDMPYSTLSKILAGGVSNASVINIEKICDGLNITVQDLIDSSDENFVPRPKPTERELQLLCQYRDKPEIQQAVDKLLDM